MSCCGSRLLFTTHHTSVCFHCGIEKSVPFSAMALQKNSNHYATHAPLVPAYSRKKRFLRLFDAVVAPSPQPADEKMIRFLFGKPKFETLPDLLRAMRCSPLKDKRYTSVHLLCQLFVKDYVPPPPPSNIHALRKHILWQFDEVQFAHRRQFPEDHFFFNYNWLLGHCLEKQGLARFLKYVKPLKCKKRRVVYETMMKTLLTTRLDKHVQVAAYV